MIGPRVGIATGVRIGPAIGVSAAGTLPVILGFPFDSNGVGQTITPDEWDETFLTTTEVTAVPYRKIYSQSSNNPIPYLTPITTGGVRQYNVNGVQNQGIQLTFAQEAVRAGFSCAWAELSVSGIKALQCAPGSTFPTLPPGGPNLFSQGLAQGDAVAAALGGVVRAAPIIVGGNDGFDATEAANVGTRLLEIVDGLVAHYPSIKIPMIRQPDFQGIASTVPFLTTIQAGQDACAAARPTTVTLIPTNDLKGHSDHLHYDGDSACILGQRVFFATLDALGIARVRHATTPQIVGWGPQYMGTGAYSPLPPGCGISGDLEILFAITQLAAGTNNPVNTPTTTGTAWTAVGSQVLATASGTTSRLAIFARPVTANRASTATDLTTVPSNGNTINGGRIVTIRGPNSLAVANIELAQLSAGSAFQTAFTVTGGNTLSANSGVIVFAGGYRTNATANPATFSGGNVSGLTRRFTGNRVVTADFITNACADAVLAAIGATGNFSVTFALNTLGVGAVLGVKP